MPIVHANGKTSYDGLVLHVGELNGYHDSDFYALVWDPEKEVVSKVFYDSTRYASSGDRAIPDATQEVKDAYQRYLRKEFIKDQLIIRKARMEDAKELGLKDRHALDRLYNAFPRTSYGENCIEMIRKLLTVKTFRSTFRESLARQVRTWSNDRKPTFKQPLSPKQLDALMVRHR